METGCVAVEWATGSVVIVVVEVEVAVAAAVASTRIQHRTPKLRLRAPSTPTCNGSGGVLFLSSEQIMLGVSYSSPLFGIKRSNPESGLAAVGKVVPQAASWIF